VWSPWQCTQRSQCNSQDLPQNLNLVLLDEDDPGHQETKNFCLHCQQWKNQLIKGLCWRSFLFQIIQTSEFMLIFFGPMITVDSHKKFVLCITDAFTKYAVVTAKMVADTIYRDWFSKFRILARIHTDSQAF
jgi:hypothetical protein